MLAYIMVIFSLVYLWPFGPLVYFLHFRVLHQEKWDNPAQELSYQYICIYLHIYINAVENIKLKKILPDLRLIIFGPKIALGFLYLDRILLFERHI
jgi:hypothetical protein